jgi:acetamidase/formamidase
MLKLAALSLAALSFAQGATYTLKASPSTIVWGYYWSQAKPVLHVKSGDIVNVTTMITNSPKGLEHAGLKPEDVQPELRAIFDQVKDRGPGGHILTGPIYVDGAEPGDALEVRILGLKPSIPYSYNAFRPGSGALPDDFKEGKMRIVRLDLKRNVADWSDDIKIPMKPFFGSMGVAPPPSEGRVSSGPPNRWAGNLDNKDLVAGTTLFIPVFVPGALFEVGDGHAAMGDGEVDITALETSMTGRLQLIVRKDLHLTWPRAETPSSYIVMGIDKDLNEAARIAVRQSIDFLSTEKHMSREDAYMLSSVAVNFVVTELVDGTKGVHGIIPKSIFGGGGPKKGSQ